MSRLDRILISPCFDDDLEVVVGVSDDRSNCARDHYPVCVSLSFSCSRHKNRHRRVPSWVCTHPKFQDLVWKHFNFDPNIWQNHLDLKRTIKKVCLDILAGPVLDCPKLKSVLALRSFAPSALANLTVTTFVFLLSLWSLTCGGELSRTKASLLYASPMAAPLIACRLLCAP